MKDSKLENPLVVLTVVILPMIILLSLAGLIYFEKAIVNKTQYITILNTNDVHGRLEPFSYKNKKGLVGGLARRAALIKSIEGSNKNVITVDSGDFAQGTLFFNLFSGIPDVKLMKEAGYNIATLGNHEFDKGLKGVKNILEHAKYPFVCANIRFTKDQELQSLVKPYIIESEHGLKIAVIGLIAPDLKTLVNNLKNVEVLDPVKTTRNIVKEVNSRADLIMVLSHMGISKDIILAEKVPEIDVIVGGHSHTLLKHPKIFNKTGDKTLVIQDGEFGVNLGRLDISIKNKVIQNYYYNLIPVNGEIIGDTNIKNEIKVLSKKIEKYKNEKVGELAFTIGKKGEHINSELLKAGSLLTEAIKHQFPDVDIVLQNSGGIRIQKRINPGMISLADILSLYPFKNSVVIFELKGKDLKSVLETSSRKYPYENEGFLQSLGLEYTIDPAKAHQVLSNDGTKIIKKGQRVSNIKINGKPLENDKYYKIALNDYVFNGGNGYSQFKKAVNVNKTGMMIQDLVVNYIKKNSPVSAEVKDKINLLRYKIKASKTRKLQKIGN